MLPTEQPSWRAQREVAVSAFGAYYHTSGHVLDVCSRFGVANRPFTTHVGVSNRLGTRAASAKLRAVSSWSAASRAGKQQALVSTIRRAASSLSAQGVSLSTHRVPRVGSLPVTTEEEAVEAATLEDLGV